MRLTARLNTTMARIDAAVPQKFWFWFWMSWLGVFVVAETITLLSPGRGDTLSEQVWFLQQAWWPLTILLGILFVFLIWHFIWDKRSRR